MHEFVKSILTYLVIVAVLGELVQKKSYLGFFRFVSGLIFILILTGPILSLTQGGEDWMQLLEERILKMDEGETREQMKLCHGGYAKEIKKQYRLQVRRSVRKMGQDRGIQLREIGIVLQKEKGSWRVTGIVVEQMEGIQKLGVEFRRCQALRQQICESYGLTQEQVTLPEGSGNG